MGPVAVRICNSCNQPADQSSVDLATTVDKAIRRIDGLLALPSGITVDVEDRPGFAIPEIGVGGESFGTRVPLDIDPTFDRFGETVRVWVPIVLAHELDESKRMLDGPGPATTLLDWLVMDGLADHFALQAFPASPPSPWDHALTNREERHVWNQAMAHLNEIVSF